MTDSGSIKSIVIVGGGSAGWMTAAGLSSMLNPNAVEITLIESDAIGTIGVGEATIPDIINFNRILGIPEDEFMKATNATFKLGIEFNNWGQKGDQYFHPFGAHGADMQGIDFHQFWLHARSAGDPTAYEDYSMCSAAAKKNKFSFPKQDPRSALSKLGYAYHFDATLYAQFLRKYAEKRGVKRIEGKVETITQNPETGYIESLTLKSGAGITGQFFFDCTGFRSLLLSKTLDVDFVDWSHWLPCNSAQAVACESEGPLLPYTKATAKDAGWQWRIPTQHRTGNGHIYSNDFTSDQEAGDELLSGLDGATMGTPKQLRFKTGRYDKLWEKNCIAIGLSAGFLEPLESTSLYLIQMGISRFISLYPDASLSPIIRDEYNTQMKLLFDNVRDFLILHYSATEREDTPFWVYCKNMPVPDTLTHKMNLFKESGRIFRYEDELFTTPSWSAVFIGQNIYPRITDPIVGSLSHDQVRKSLHSMQRGIETAVDKMPTHSEFIQKFCPSSTY